MNKKTVLMPIEVPDNDYCWNGNNCCEHFDNTGGHPSCDLGFWPEKNRSGFIFKPVECAELEKK